MNDQNKSDVVLFDSVIDAVFSLYVPATEKLVASVEKIVDAFEKRGCDVSNSRYIKSAVVVQAFLNLRRHQGFANYG